MWMKFLSLVALIVLAFGCWLAAGRLFGFAHNLPLFMAIPGVLFACGLVWIARRMSDRIWIFVGLFILAGLFFLPSYSISTELMDSPWPRWLIGVRDLLTGLWPDIIPSLAIITAALLLSSGLNHLMKWRQTAGEDDSAFFSQQKAAVRIAVICLALSALLLVKTLHNLYWVMVWDNTDDPIEYIWLILPFLAVLFSSFVMVIVLPRWTKLAGLVYTLIVPILMVVVSARGQQIDFRQFTEARGKQVVQALDTYYARERRYPQNLRQLIPWTILSLPGPVIIYGEDWCYDGGDTYYRLGYVDREHWSSPILFGTIYKTKGKIPDLPPICDKEISAALKKRYPDVYK